MMITGYRRKNGGVGIRNNVVIISSVVCANRVVELIAAQVPSVIPVTHQHGCGQIGEDNEQTLRTLSGIGKNANVAAVLVVGLGCETLQAKEIYQEIVAAGKNVRHISIQQTGGVLNTITKGVQIVSEMLRKATQEKREEVSLKDIIIGLECGGSDTTSGLASNPATGVASNFFVRNGGTVILSETTEFIGAEHLLAERALNATVKEKLYEIISKVEEEIKRAGNDIRGSNPTPGNINGGITTIEEKSLGCINKAGSNIINEVVLYAQSPSQSGLVVMDTPGQDVESITGMIAGGANLIIFTTGMGTPTGSLISPVVKVCGNPNSVKIMGDSIDVDVSGVMEGEKSIDEAAEKIIQRCIDVINGGKTKSEIMGQNDFAIKRLTASM